MQKFTAIHGIIIDMDGVLWQGNKPLRGLQSFFKVLRKRQIPFILATNNSTLTPESYVDKFEKMGVMVTKKEILTSSQVTANYLAEHYPPSQHTVFMIGEEGLKAALLAQGFTLKWLNEFPYAELVVCGLNRQLSWNQLATATLTLRAGAQFIATNADTSLPTEAGIVPGNGATLAALTAATNGMRPTCLGKPEPLMYQYALKLLKTTASETIALGDRLDTDILGAVNADMRSIMVLTGISSEADVKKSDYKPTWIMDDLVAVTEAIISV